MIQTYYKGENLDKRMAKAIEWGNGILAPFEAAGVTVFVAGGAFRSYFLGQKPEDIDLWFPDAASLLKAQRVLHDRGKAVGLPEGTEKYAESYELPGGLFKEPITYQCVSFEFFPTLESVLEQFDFTVCMCGMGWDYLSMHSNYFVDLLENRLVLNQLETPNQFFYRLQKYVNKGFSLPDDEVEKVVDSIQIWDGKGRLKERI